MDDKLVKSLLLSFGAAVAGFAWFMRDPRRRPPDQPDSVLAPADGRVVMVERTVALPGQAGPVWRIAIFLGLGDVHVQRAPIAGRIVLSRLQSGGHRPAFDSRATMNAGHWLGIESAIGPVLVLRTAGLIARRVTTAVMVGDTVTAGQRIGRILLGSRTEVYLPECVQPEVKRGMTVRAGETIIARRLAAPP